VQMPTDASKESVLQAAKSDEKVASHLAGKTVQKEIYIPGKLVNFVV
jgi:leucyl-tRNA synthetase